MGAPTSGPHIAASALRERYASLAERLSAPDGASFRDELKGEIIALFRSIEQETTELAALKSDVRLLVDRWKALGGASAAEHVGVPPEPIPLAPATLQTDHLGASTYIEKGWGQLATGDAVAAEASLSRALQLAPGDPQAEALLGWALMLQAKYDDALWLFQKVLLREPDNALARVNVGYICHKKGIFGEAIEHLGRAVRQEKDRKAQLYAHFYLGLVYLEREMYDDAEGFLRQTLALGPNLIEAYYELGRTLWFGGQTEAARDTWRDGFAANKFNPWGKRCAELLDIVAKGGEPPRVS